MAQPSHQDLVESDQPLDNFMENQQKDFMESNTHMTNVTPQQLDFMESNTHDKNPTDNQQS